MYEPRLKGHGHTICDHLPLYHVPVPTSPKLFLGITTDLRNLPSPLASVPNDNPHLCCRWPTADCSVRREQWRGFSRCSRNRSTVRIYQVCTGVLHACTFNFSCFQTIQLVFHWKFSSLFSPRNENSTLLFLNARLFFLSWSGKKNFIAVNFYAERGEAGVVWNIWIMKYRNYSEILCMKYWNHNAVSKKKSLFFIVLWTKDFLVSFFVESFLSVQYLIEILGK